MWVGLAIVCVLVTGLIATGIFALNLLSLLFKPRDEDAFFNLDDDDF
jgi:hypothetical protein